ncbi:MBL fold metallo-hydrolase [Conchiformibius kuhniae]|uniref:MBL fold metallo-hydrolase n=1 Tax=Conchiformibius kuhniae TaxID=211502 RepID=A0A8T9MVY8_9NEIS|nr:MBL fold metallo-hydrolase [Conchiformibius kuhniae]UOP04332.1 MBL fold metallo-hydrolase [Conchiformibius kuhniae]
MWKPLAGLAAGLLVAGMVFWRWQAVDYPAYPHSRQYRNGAFANDPPTRPVAFGGAVYSLWRLLTASRQFAPPQPLPAVRPDWQAFLADGGKIKMLWFGHSSTLMRVGGQTVFFDPVFAASVSPVPLMMRRFQPPPATLHDLPPVDVVVYTHNHYDHLDKTALRHFAAGDTRFIVPLGMGALLQSWGVAAERIREADWWDKLDLGAWQLHAVPARHNSGRGGGDRNRSLWCGWVVQTAHEQIYYSGDSAYGAHFAEIGRRFGGFDLALLENGQYNPAWADNHMFPEQTAQAAQDVRAKRVMPVHWGAYALSIHAWDEPVRRLLPLLQQSDTAALTPVQGQVFDRETPTEKWWEQEK